MTLNNNNNTMRYFYAQIMLFVFLVIKTQVALAGVTDITRNNSTLHIQSNNYRSAQVLNLALDKNAMGPEEISLSGNNTIQENRLLPELDSEGLKEDAYYFFGYQFFVIGVLYISPESVSGWSEDQKKNFTIEKYKKNTRQMIWDSDKFYINYVLHPYWGMSYYVRARERGATEVGSFWYAELLSTLWEFGVEALFEEVSIQDLFVTPIMGAIIGKYVDVYRQSVKAKPVKTSYDDFMLGLTDPLGAANRGTKRLFGKSASVSFTYSVLSSTRSYITENAESAAVSHFDELDKLVSPTLGISLKYQF